MKLFAIYIGGEMEGAHIELHDMRFAVGEYIEDTYDELLRQWWGKPGSMHLDAWAELTRADGHSITLSLVPQESPLKLFYVNVGGYSDEEFTELHKNIFVVAENESKAKVRALKSVRHWQSFHRDDLYEAEQVMCLNTQLGKWHIHLEKTDDNSPPPFICRYTPIGKA